jgi:hypothetical protein
VGHVAEVGTGQDSEEPDPDIGFVERNTVGHGR